ncbi:MAG: NUDIX domain-containing protein [Anaerolineales bacterium]|nr:NUDIX domain-containing protein [Anaerolineales bacterium]
MFTFGAFALIFNEMGQILLNQRRDNQRWNLPGGRVEAGELPNETVVRETLEETGLQVEVDNFVGFYAKEGESDFVITFQCHIIGGEIQLSTAETLDCRYFSINELPSNIHPYHIWRIFDAIKKAPRPIFTRQSLSSA